MRIMRSAVLTLFVILLSAPLLDGQDLSNYRNFSFGMSLAQLSKQLDLRPLHTELLHERPAVIQELTWRPRDSSGSSLQAGSIRQILFTFYNGELYKIVATYDRRATEGLTIEDVVEAISAEYGTATRPDVEISFPTNELYMSTEKVIARWEDTQYSFNLFRSTVLNTFGLVMFSKELDAQVRAAVAASIKLEGEEDRQKEIERQEREADELEAARQKNRKAFRP
jgi:hypothetical protein